MHTHHTITIIVMAVALAAGAVTFVFYEETHDASPTSSSDTVIGSEEVGSVEYWVDRFNERDSETVYEEFKEANASYGRGTQHVNAHAFGEALFEARDLDGVSVCDTSFTMGCYHAYLARAIHTHGINVADDLNSVCRTLGIRALSCQHGIGHGVQSYLGYEADDLPAGLAVCSELPSSDPIGGCYGGVFMEYNMRTMLLDQAELRQLDDSRGLHAPCNALARAHKSACYYWQPEWWSAILHAEHTDSETVYKEMGVLCRELDDRSLTRVCFKGVGNIAAQDADFAPEKTVTLCRRSAGAHTAYEIDCRSEAAYVFSLLPAAVADAPRVCDGLSDVETDQCRDRGTSVLE